MASPQETNRKVAEALGWSVLPWGTEAERPCIWEGEDDVLFVRRFKIACESGCDCRTERWNPATDPADALACLEEWCKDKMQWAHKASIELCAGGYSVQISTSPKDEDVATIVGGMDLPAIICQAIINAEAGK